MKRIIYIILIIFLISTLAHSFQLNINSSVQYIRPQWTPQTPLYTYSKDLTSQPELFNFPPGEKVTVMGKWVEPYEIIGLPLTYHPLYISDSGTINAQISWGNLNAPDYIYFEIEMENELAKVYREKKHSWDLVP